MPRTYVMASAFLAVALSACAGTAVQTSTAPHYLGGRAGQPGGWSTTAPVAHDPNQHSPAVAQSGGVSYLGGRAGEPGSWLPPSDVKAPSEQAREYAYQGGRAGQPWSGPSVH